ncbi:MAG: flagellar biosynthesis protein FlgB [Maritimibacter sp.]|mgnify:CR=1 FL=1|nr:flagellar biosynthesis protein FlgB [Maritimibacter sp.]
MFQNLEIFRMANALAQHSSARQAEVAANIANADTPGYRAGDLAPFSEVYGNSRPGDGLRATRPGHIAVSASAAAPTSRTETRSGAAPNGNTVSVEAEMMKSVAIKHDHETALSVYESARNILRTSLGRGR